MDLIVVVVVVFVVGVVEVMVAMDVTMVFEAVVEILIMVLHGPTRIISKERMHKCTLNDWNFNYLYLYYLYRLLIVSIVPVTVWYRGRG